MTEKIGHYELYAKWLSDNNYTKKDKVIENGKSITVYQKFRDEVWNPSRNSDINIKSKNTTDTKNTTNKPKIIIKPNSVSNQNTKDKPKIVIKPKSVSKQNTKNKPIIKPKVTSKSKTNTKNINIDSDDSDTSDHSDTSDDSNTSNDSNDSNTSDTSDSSDDIKNKSAFQIFMENHKQLWDKHKFVNPDNNQTVSAYRVLQVAWAKHLNNDKYKHKVIGYHNLSKNFGTLTQLQYDNRLKKLPILDTSFMRNDWKWTQLKFI